MNDNLQKGRDQIKREKTMVKLRKRMMNEKDDYRFGLICPLQALRTEKS